MNAFVPQFQPVAASGVRKASWAYAPVSLLIMVFLFVPFLCTAGIAIAPNLERATNNSDALQTAIRHYEADDLPDSKTLDLFNQAATDGDTRGKMWLARLRFMGRCSLPKRTDIAQTEAKAVIRDIINLAEHGDVEAQFLLGSSYQEGLAVDRDFEKAAQWYEKAAESGHVTAMNNLGIMVAHAHGVEADLTKARRLFARAAKLGSKLAAKNLEKFQDHGREDDFESLRRLPLVQALGMQKDEAIVFLSTNGLISNSKGFVEGTESERLQLFFKADGIALNIDPNGRVMNVEAYGNGTRGAEQFRGELPFGISWTDTSTTAQDKLGFPDDCGDVNGDNAYGMAYWLKNISCAVMFSYKDNKQLKIWRVFEVYAVKYPPVQPAEQKLNPHMASLAGDNNG